MQTLKPDSCLNSEAKVQHMWVRSPDWFGDAPRYCTMNPYVKGSVGDPIKMSKCTTDSIYNVSRRHAQILDVASKTEGLLRGFYNGEALDKSTIKDYNIAVCRALEDGPDIVNEYNAIVDSIIYKVAKETDKKPDFLVLITTDCEKERHMFEDLMDENWEGSQLRHRLLRARSKLEWASRQIAIEQSFTLEKAKR